MFSVSTLLDPGLGLALSECKQSRSSPWWVWGLTVGTVMVLLN